MSADIALAYAQRLYRVTLDFATICEIEDEMGSLGMVYARLTQGAWTAGELVSLCHILLARAGCSCDYMALGQDMVAQGFERYRSAVASLLARVFTTDEG